jgi:hypothetical protein
MASAGVGQQTDSEISRMTGRNLLDVESGVKMAPLVAMSVGTSLNLRLRCYFFKIITVLLVCLPFLPALD